MMTYEKPWAEFVSLESERVMTDIGGPGLDMSEGLEEWD